MTEDWMVGWHPQWQLNGCEFEQIPGDSEGQRNLQCCTPVLQKVEHDWETEQQREILIEGRKIVPKPTKITGI